MNRFFSQCHERCFCDFCNSSFLIRGSVTVHWPPVFQKFWKVELSIYVGISLTRFNHQNVAKRKFLCSNFRSPKVQYKERWAVDVFRNWQASRKKYHILYSSRGVCSNCAKSWRKAEGPAKPLPKLLPYKVRPNKRTSICLSIASLC